MRVDKRPILDVCVGWRVRNVNPLGVSLQSEWEASVDPGCSRSQVMMGLAKKN